MATQKNTGTKLQTKSSANKKEISPATSEAKSSEVKVGKVLLKLTNPQKLYWPADKITKGELVNYYSEIAPVILPYLQDRPESMHRFPNGIDSPAFYQKNVDTEAAPEWLHTEKIFSGSTQEDINYLICNDRETLMYMANLGCIEIHPWSSRTSAPDKPDWLVIDLDPGEIAFAEVVRCAQAARAVFDKLEMDCYCKTSGATGLHIFAPVGAKYEYEMMRELAEMIAHEIHGVLPDTTSLERNPKNRKTKIYIDYLQNSKGQTLAAPYSVRPHPGAPVSTPLDWSELTAKLDPKNYNMKNIFKRLDKKGDLWKGVMGKKANLSQALKMLATSE